MGELIGVFGGLGVLLVVAAAITFTRLIHICAPNEVLIFSGKRRMVGGRSIGYRLVKGGRGFRIPMFEQVDRMDLTNMVIEVTAQNAYSKGGVPLSVQGVANVKIAGHEPVLNNAIERFLGQHRGQVMTVAKATLEGSLRGVLATLTPEQVNEDKLVFAQQLVHEVEQDMTALGLVVDTLKIQNVSDEVGYLDSLGRQRTAALLRRARIAEATTRADALVRAAENRQRETQAKFTAQTAVVQANAEKRMADAVTRLDAVVAEELAEVAAAVAGATADVAVNQARIEQVRRQLEADVIQPAIASLEAAEQAARAAAAPIIADGKARAEVLATLAASWAKAGDHAREVFLLQKLDSVIDTITGVIADTKIDKITMIDAGGAGANGSLTKSAVSGLEQIKQVFGVDLLDALKSKFGDKPSLPSRDR